MGKFIESKALTTKLGKIKELKSREEAFTLKSLIFMMVITGLPFVGASVYVTANPTPTALENLEETTNSFEEWSVKNPDKFQHVIEHGIDFKELSLEATGEEAHSRLDQASVEYISNKNGTYELCIDRKNDNHSTTPYRYYSQGQRLVKDNTCNL
ncbi:MAG: hypothetical protein H9W81_07430 [Enterococcus sp.]|nr:hypothetical protein [Enterococcus sp.]